MVAADRRAKMIEVAVAKCRDDRHVARNRNPMSRQIAERRHGIQRIEELRDSDPEVDALLSELKPNL